MLCGVCWRAPWPTQPAVAGDMALGAWHDLCRLGMVASSSAGAPFSSCRSCESFTVQRGGGPGWAPPPGAGRPHPPVRPGLGAAAAVAGRGELRLLFSPPNLGSLAVLVGPSRPQRDIIRTNSAKVQEQQQSGSSQALTSTLPPPIYLPHSFQSVQQPLLKPPCAPTRCSGYRHSLGAWPDLVLLTVSAVLVHAPCSLSCDHTDLICRIQAACACAF